MSCSRDMSERSVSMVSHCSDSITSLSRSLLDGPTRSSSYRLRPNDTLSGSQPDYPARTLNGAEIRRREKQAGIPRLASTPARSVLGHLTCPRSIHRCAASGFAHDPRIAGRCRPRKDRSLRWPESQSPTSPAPSPPQPAPECGRGRVQSDSGARKLFVASW